VRRYFVYILASSRRGTLYIGITGDLNKRISLHQANIIRGFTQKYLVHELVYFEEHDTAIQAIAREKQLKNWKRKWKIEQIENTNPSWDDLSEELNIT
jgi:putative endonuclease